MKEKNNYNKELYSKMEKDKKISKSYDNDKKWAFKSIKELNISFYLLIILLINLIIVKSYNETISINQSFSMTNSTLLNLGECEDKLRKVYNISDKEKLYIFKTEKIEEGSKIPKINYEIYCYLNSSNLVKLDLKYCETKIEISFIVSIQEFNGCLNDFYKIILNKPKCSSECGVKDIYKYKFQNNYHGNYSLYSNYSTNKDDNFELFYLDYNYICKPSCSEDNPLDIAIKQECEPNCTTESIGNKSCILNILGNKTEEYKKNKNYEINIYNIILNNIEKGFTSSAYNISYLEKGNDDIYKFDKITVTLTTLYNKKDEKRKLNNEDIYYKNINQTIVDLEECEEILRKEYNITDNKKIFMKKIDIKQEYMKIPKIEYDVYSQLNSSNLTNLNISNFAEMCKAYLLIPLNLNEEDNYDILNSSSGYYNDLCYPANSDTGTDITLNDRRYEFIKDNKTVCQENCVFVDYYRDIKKIKCACKLQKSSSSFANMHIDKQKLLNNFINIENIANINILICHKVLFSIKGITKNYGSYLILFILLLHFIFIFLFYIKKSPKILENKINDIAFCLEKLDLIRTEKEKKKIKRKKLIKDTIEENEYIKNENKEIKSENKEKKIKLNPIKKRIKKEKKIKNRFNIKEINIIKKENSSVYSKNIKGESINKLKLPQIKKEIISKIQYIMSYNDKEINNLSYKLAKKCDKRTYCQYYISLLRIKHTIILTFFNNTDYNDTIIKIDLLLFTFTLNLVVNALFFNDNTMHKIYEDKGSYDFIYQIPQITYSFLISTIINMILKLFSLSEGLILEFKKQEKKEDLYNKMTDLKNKLKIRFILYFTISSIFLIIFWYYISMFCAIYVNTQIHLIKDTIISFAFSLIYPFGINLIPGIFRNYALSNNRNKKKYLYNFSKIIQFI